MSSVYRNLQHLTLLKKKPAEFDFNMKKPAASDFDIRKPATVHFDIKKPATPDFDIKKPATPEFDIKTPGTPEFNMKKYLELSNNISLGISMTSLKLHLTFEHSRTKQAIQ